MLQTKVWNMGYMTKFCYRRQNIYYQQWGRQVGVMLIGLVLAIVLNSCSRLVIQQYQATALTTYTWRVEYFISPNEKLPRTEEFASSSLLNVNGIKPESADGEADDKGLWWPPLPPRPTLAQIEQRQKPSQRHTRPELLRTVKYHLSYEQDGQKVTLPTNYSVYRQAVKAYSKGQSLKLTLGINNRWVEKAKP